MNKRIGITIIIGIMAFIGMNLVSAIDSTRTTIENKQVCHNTPEGKVCCTKNICSITPIYEEPTYVDLMITSNGGDGDGTVTVSPKGIDFDGKPSYTYLQGTIVKITAEPDRRSKFIGWSGECLSENSNVCTLTLDTSKSLTANFELLPVEQRKRNTANHFFSSGPICTKINNDPWKCTFMGKEVSESFANEYDYSSRN